MTVPETSDSLATQAYRAIKDDIIRGHLAGDARLTEQELAVRHGLGKTPVREALTRLSQEGLVQVRPRRGYGVAPISIKDVEDTFTLRLLLEPEAARLAAGQADLAELRRLDELASAVRTTSDPDAIVRGMRTHAAFHIAIGAASGNRRLAGWIERLFEDLERVHHLMLRLGKWPTPVISRHGELLSALDSGDGDRAAAVTRSRIIGTRDKTMGILLSHPQLWSIDLASLPPVPGADRSA